MAVKNQEHIEKIKTTYKEFETSLLRQGMFLSRDTGIGYWGVTPILDLHTFFEQLGIEKHNHLIDLGSGDGRVVLLAAAMGIKATGIEADDWLMKHALTLKQKIDHPSMENAQFISDDFMKMDIGKFDLVYVSPDRPFYRGLEDKMQRELTGALIVHGYEFLPHTLKLQKQFTINGEQFGLYHK